MSKYIDRAALFNSLANAKTLADAFAAIQEAPTADVQEVQHGYWTTGRVRGSLTDICSVCGNDSGTIYHYNYCPNCGSRMDLDEVGE